MLKGNIKLILASLFLAIMALIVSCVPSAEANNATTVATIKQASSEQVRCLATGIYYEADQEPTVGQIAVARVIVNRVVHGFGSTPCKVVYQTTKLEDRKICQFSWACEEFQSKVNQQRYQKAERIARAVLTENAWNDIVPDNVLYFHNTSVNPKWKLRKYSTIGNHVFYSQGREKNV